MATQSAKPITVAGFTGIDNASPLEALRPGAAREMVNVDLDKQLKPQLRGGYALRLAATHAHSLASSSLGMLAVLDGTLSRFDATFAEVEAIRAGLTPEPLCYAELNGDVYWTNGAHFRRVRGIDLADTPGWIDCAALPTLTIDATTGGLRAGDYQVAMTFLDADGRESGADGAVVVTVPQGGGILATPGGAPAEAVKARFYTTGCNDDVFRFHREVLLPHPPVLLGASGHGRGKPIETLFLMPLPAGHLLAAHNARLWMAVDHMLYWSEAYRYGLYEPDSGFNFVKPITLLQPCGDAAASGLFVAAGKRTYFLGGADPEKQQRNVCYPHGAQLGSGRTVPGKLLGLDYAGPVATWVGSNGVWVAGLPTGQVVPLTEGQLVLPSAERAAVLVRERQGLRQIVMALQGQITGNALAMSDDAVATVRRNNVVLP